MRKSKRLVSFFVAAIMLFGAVPASAASAFSQSEAEPSVAMSPLQSYRDLGLHGMDSITEEDLVQYTESLFGTNRKNPRKATSKKGSLPLNGTLGDGGMTEAYVYDAISRSEYSSVREGYINSPHDQGSSMDCWIFAANAAAEASYAVNNDVKERFSVAQVRSLMNGYKYDVLGNSTGDRNVPVRGGGNSVYYMFSAAAWNGLESDRTLPYGEYAEGVERKIEPSLLYGNDIARIEAGMFLPYISTDEVLAVYKLLVVSGGAVVCDYRHDDEFFNFETNAYYYDAEKGYCNHQVAIVGWDDNYSAQNFNSGHQPPRNGAWLAKNSWGTEWGDNGYFWISYYDLNVESITAVECYSSDRFQYNYQYDGGFSIKSAAVSPNSTISNAYTVKGLTSDKERVDAVGLFVDSAGVTGTVSIYKDEGGKIPVNGKLLAQTDFEIYFPGYYTVEIPDGPVLSAGESFTVSVSFDQEANIMIDTTKEEYTVSCRTDTKEERTALRTANGVVRKLSGTPRIKAFTNDAGGVATGNHTVTFDANGGALTPVAQIKPKNQPLRLQFAQPVLEDGKFLGWSRDKNATSAEFVGGDYYTEDKDVTLYAVWQITYPMKDKDITLSPSSIKLMTGGDAAEVTVSYGERFPDVNVRVANVLPQFVDGKAVYRTQGLLIVPTGDNSFSVKAERFTSSNITVKLTDKKYPQTEFELNVRVMRLGDVNQDGKLTVLDSLLLKRIILGIITGRDMIDCADINRDGKVNILDSYLLKKRILGLQ